VADGVTEGPTGASGEDAARMVLLRSLLGRSIKDVGFDVEHPSEQWVELSLDDGRLIRIGGYGPLILDDETARQEQAKAVERLRIVAQVLTELEIDDPAQTTEAELALAARLAAERLRASGLA
jgi:hypothetical protein